MSIRGEVFSATISFISSFYNFSSIVHVFVRYPSLLPSILQHLIHKMSTENGHANGNGHATTRTPGIAEVRGPLGIGSASLAGKVALVTGSGEYQLL
jgi:hypothetical protein